MPFPRSMPRTMPRSLAALPAAVLLLTGLTACGSSADDPQVLTVLAAASLTETFTDLADEFEAALKEADSYPDPEPAEILDHVFAEPTPQLKRQREQILSEQDSNKDTA